MPRERRLAPCYPWPVVHVRALEAHALASPGWQGLRCVHVCPVPSPLVVVPVSGPEHDDHDEGYCCCGCSLSPNVGVGGRSSGALVEGGESQRLATTPLVDPTAVVLDAGVESMLDVINILTNDSASLNDEIFGLRAQLQTVRAATIRECVAAVEAAINTGEAGDRVDRDYLIDMLRALLNPTNTDGV